MTTEGMWAGGRGEVSSRKSVLIDPLRYDSHARRMDP